MTSCHHALALCLLFAVCGSPLVDATLRGTSHVAIGGDKDEHGCLTSAGYSWCEGSQNCVRTWETPCADGGAIGGDKDAHGCVLMAGYSWCETKSKCLRIWEESC